MKYSDKSYLIGFLVATVYSLLARFGFYFLAVLVVVVGGISHVYLMNLESKKLTK